MHKRTEAQGRIYYVSPEVILGHARGRTVEPARLRRIFRLRQLTLQVRRQRRITAVDGTSRQPYRQAQMIQLVFWALELARTVWRMPRYRRATWLHRMSSAPQIPLFDEFGLNLTHL